MKMTLIETLLKFQKQAGFKHSDIQAKLGWSGAKFHRIKTEKQPVTWDELNQWAKVIGCDIEHSLKPINLQEKSN